MALDESLRPIEMNCFIHLFSKYLMILLIFRVFLYAFYSNSCSGRMRSLFIFKTLCVSVLQKENEAEKFKRFSERPEFTLSFSKFQLPLKTIRPQCTRL